MPAPADYGISETDRGIRVRVYVAPRSSSNSILGAHGGELKVSLTAPPVEGAANRALTDFLARKLGVPKSAVQITAGQTSRHKTLAIEGISAEGAMTKLGLS
jgi:uncharacterized protein (TIGR00251 family)